MRSLVGLGTSLVADLVDRGTVSVPEKGRISVAWEKVRSSFVLAGVAFAMVIGASTVEAAARNAPTAPGHSLCKGGAWESLGLENLGDCVRREAQGLIWNLTTSYRMSPNQANPNPDRYGVAGVWDFGAVQAGSQADPAAFQRLSFYNVGEGPHASQQGWEWLSVAPPGTPWAYPNVHSQGFGERIGVHPGRVNIDPEYVVVRWNSPVNGTVQVQGHLSDGDEAGIPGSGCPKSLVDGVEWELRSVTGEASALLASGSFGDGGGQAIQSAVLQVNIGDSVWVLVGPGNNFFCDSTTLSLTIVGDRSHGANAHAHTGDSGEVPKLGFSQSAASSSMVSESTPATVSTSFHEPSSFEIDSLEPNDEGWSTVPHPHSILHWYRRLPR